MPWKATGTGTGPEDPFTGKTRDSSKKRCSGFNKFGRASDQCNMRSHDLVSDGFLTLTAASLVLLCSSLLAFALA